MVTLVIHLIKCKSWYSYHWMVTEKYTCIMHVLRCVAFTVIEAIWKAIYLFFYFYFSPKMFFMLTSALMKFIRRHRRNSQTYGTLDNLNTSSNKFVKKNKTQIRNKIYFKNILKSNPTRWDSLQLYFSHVCYHLTKFYCATHIPLSTLACKPFVLLWLKVSSYSLLGLS